MAAVVVAYSIVQSALIRRDAIRSVENMGKILHQAQEDAKAREGEIWQRAQVDVELARAQAKEATDRLATMRLASGARRSSGQQRMPLFEQNGSASAGRRSEFAGMR